jgi:hypothetical protein
MIWDREAGHTGNLKGSLQYCGADSDSSGLCPEHAAFVADAKCPEVSKLDMKHWYRVPAKRKAKLGPSSVKHTVEPPSPRRLEYVAWKTNHAKQDKGFIQWALDEDKRAKAASEPSPFTAYGQSKIARARAAEQAAFMQRRADAEAKEVKRRADEWKAAQAKIAALEPVAVVSAEVADAFGMAGMPNVIIAEPNAETVCGFRFEYRAEGGSGSGFYWNGKRVASTREGLERMGPAILAKVCKV